LRIQFPKGGNPGVVHGRIGRERFNPHGHLLEQFFAGGGGPAGGFAQGILLGELSIGNLSNRGAGKIVG
jgi:hypothetical protein